MTVARKPAVRRALAKAKPRVAPGDRRATAKNQRLAGVGAEAVLRATGKDWDQWLAVLDRAGAKKMTHKEIALLLSRKCNVPDWWSQMVTVGYEQARGLRDVYQHADGYAANTSRTFEISVEKLFDAWSDPRVRSRWMAKAPVEVRRAVEPKSIRMAWKSGGSRVEVNFFAKGTGRSQVQVEHAKLPSTTAVARQKTYWAAALARLKALLEDER